MIQTAEQVKKVGKSFYIDTGVLSELERIARFEEISLSEAAQKIFRLGIEYIRSVRK